MTQPPARPDPDLLLRRVSAAEQREKRAKLKIFFGFAPGVGKTYRMLQVARDLTELHKVDVLVGAIETHGRYDTGALLLGLDILPRRRVEYRGRVLEEFDLDAALARRPTVLLLDELAHTNAPGARHAKRWQDVIDLLDAGIHVYTTLNVQHIESLNDVIAQITRIQVRETVPDSILERADEIELVDIAPEELLTRLREGKVYLPEQAARAANHFFQHGNLLALRELALRRTAERVDADVQAYREQQGVAVPWPAGEHILVCVGPAPASGRLVRAGRRMAAGLRSPWVVAYVDATLTPLGDADRQRLEAHLRLAEALGASVVRLSGSRVSQAILDYARTHHITRIIVGKPTHSRLRDRLRGSLLDEIVRGSGAIDIHVIAGDLTDAETPGNHETTIRPPHQSLRPTSARTSPGGTRPWAAYLWALLAVLLTTNLAMLLRALFRVPDVEILYLLAVMSTAVRFGRGPALLCAGFSVAAYDFFFVLPYYTFAVADGRYILTFAMMFGVGWLLSTLTIRLRRQEHDAISREERTRVLYALSRELGSTLDANQAAAIICRQASESFGAACVLLVRDDSGELTPGAAWPADTEPMLDPNELGVAQWVLEHGRIAGLGTDTLPGAKALCVPLRTAGEPEGVLALFVAPDQPPHVHADQRSFLDTFSRQAALALERVRLAEQAKTAALRARTEEMRSSLLSAVSHDLRTPLGAITGAATTLRDPTATLPPEQREDLLATICEEAERLERLVSNLLDMTRLEASGLRLRREWVPIEEPLSSALGRLEPKLGTRPIHIELPQTLPLVSVDPVLLEQLFINLLENVAKYTPPGSPIDIVATAEDRQLVIEVRDRGPGLLPGTTEKVFEKFYRGNHIGISGVGLGLSICKGIAAAHGGTIVAENRAGGGAVFRITLPRTEPAPSLLDEAAQEPS